MEAIDVFRQLLGVADRQLLPEEMRSRQFYDGLENSQNFFKGGKAIMGKHIIWVDPEIKYHYGSD